MAGKRRLAAGPEIREDLGAMGSNRAWVTPVVFACVVLAWFVVRRLPGTVSDTVVLVHGARVAAWCFAHSFYSDCDRHAFFTVFTDAGAIAGNGVGPFALFQYLPALLFVKLGLTDSAIYTSLTIISLLSFCGLLAISVQTAARTGRRSAPAILAVILLTSPLIYYSGLTFGESFGALLVVGLAVAALRRWPPAVLALCAFLATITKETIFPVVALLGAVSLWATPIGRESLRRAHWYALAFGILLGIAASAGLNWFRFGQLTNRTYLSGALQVPGVTRKLDFSTALWVAPNGGVAMFWPLAAAVVIGLLWLASRARWQRSTDPRRSLPAILLVASLLLVTGTLASWYAPFGWIAWGPRLMLLTLPAVVLIAVVIYAPEIDGVVRWLLASTRRVAFSTVAVVAVGLPQINVLHAPASVFSIFSPDATCPTLPSITNPTYYYRCIDHYAWGRHWILLETVKALGHAPGILFAVAFAAVWAALLISSGPARLRIGASPVASLALIGVFAGSGHQPTQSTTCRIVSVDTTLPSNCQARGLETRPLAVVSGAIELVDGRQLRIVPQAVESSIDSSVSDAPGAPVAEISGWAASLKLHRPATAVLVFSGGRYIGAIRPVSERPDVARAFHDAALQRSGFTFVLPFGLLGSASGKTSLQLFAFAGGIASPMEFNCSTVPKQFGC